MLIKLSDIYAKYNPQIKGVIHVGGSHAEEQNDYLHHGIKKQLWIEAIPEVFKELQKNIVGNPQAMAIQACISDKSLQNKVFNVTNNVGQSSSFLPLKKHSEYYPTIVVDRTIEMITITLDDIFDTFTEYTNPQFAIQNFNFINLDIQGAELMALKGFEKNLQHIDYIYCEVNDEELYEGCAHVAEIDAFLLEQGFEGVECFMTDAHWGDKFYIRKK